MSESNSSNNPDAVATAEGPDALTFGPPGAGASQPIVVRDQGKYVCLECRTVLHSGKQCDGGPRHRTVLLNTTAGREALRSEVWGEPSLRRRARELAKAGGTGAFFDGCLQGADCAGCDAGVGDMGEFAVVVMGLIAAFFLAVLIWWIVTKIIAAVRRHRAKLKPKGALLQPPKPKGAPKTGVVQSAHGISSPNSATSVAAYAVQYVSSRFSANAVMLRDGYTNGFEVLLDSGQLLRVSPGPVRIEDEMEPFQNANNANTHLTYTLGIGIGESEEAQEFPLVPFDVAQSAEVKVGGRVAVFSEVEFVPDDRQQAYNSGAFRGGTAIMVTRGIPTLIPLDA